MACTQNGNILQEIANAWDMGANAWAKFNKYELVYDNYNNLTQSTTYTWNGTTNTNWEFEYAFHYNNYYEGTINVQYLPNNDLVALFPNPSTDFIHIQPQTTNTPLYFQLVDMQGRVIIERTIQQQQVIDIHYLAAGVYAYTIQSSNQIQNGKIIKQ